MTSDWRLRAPPSVSSSSSSHSYWSFRTLSTRSRSGSNEQQKHNPQGDRHRSTDPAVLRIPSADLCDDHQLAEDAARGYPANFPGAAQGSAVPELPGRAVWEPQLPDPDAEADHQLQHHHP